MSQEHRHFAPSTDFAKNAIAQPAIYAEAKADRLGFWAKQANHLSTFDVERNIMNNRTGFILLA